METPGKIVWETVQEHILNLYMFRVIQRIEGVQLFGRQYKNIFLIFICLESYREQKGYNCLGESTGTYF